MSRAAWILLLSSLVTLFLWVGLDVHHAYQKTSLPQIPSQLLETIATELDPATVDLIRRQE